MRSRIINSIFGAVGPRARATQAPASALALPEQPGVAANDALPATDADNAVQVLEKRAAQLQLENSALRQAEERLASQSAHFKQLFEAAPLGLVILDNNERIENANVVWQRMFGFDLDEVRGKNINEQIVPADEQAEAARMSARIFARETIRFNARRMRRNGETIDVSFTGSPILVGGEQVGIYGIYTDQTAVVNREREHIRQKEIAELTLNAIADAVVRVTDGGSIAYVNQAAERLLGLPRERLLRKCFHDVCKFVTEDAAEPITFRSLSSSNPILTLPESAVLSRKDGTTVAVEGAVTTLVDAFVGECCGGVIVMRDVSERRRAERALSFKATHDGLTGLLNREEMERRLAHAIASSSATGERSAVLYIDLDQFKVVNDTSGHQVGDRFLQRVAHSMRLALGADAVLARLGGDEFAVLLHGMQASAARSVAESILDAIRGIRFFWMGRLFRVDASIGVSEINAQVKDVAEVMAAADSACYAAKEQGRGRVRIADDDDSLLSQRRVEMDWVSRINHALEHGRFVLYRQEIRDIDAPATSNRHWEVLVRMVDDIEGVVPPDRFIPAAERYGLMPAIDRWVIAAVFRQLDRLQGAETNGADCYAINISGTSMGDEGFSEYITRCFRTFKVRPQDICFEITETAAAANLDQALQFMSRVRELGCRVSLDDFGSGFSSFTYLKAFEINYLKIDGKFVRDIDSDSINEVFVESINRIGKSLGIRTIAEYVENEAVLQKLRDIGVDCAQGHHIDTPRLWSV